MTRRKGQGRASWRLVCALGPPVLWLAALYLDTARRRGRSASVPVATASDREARTMLCSRCRHRHPTEGSFCLQCIWMLAAEAAHAYEVERKAHKPSVARGRALARLGPPKGVDID